MEQMEGASSSRGRFLTKAGGLVAGAGALAGLGAARAEAAPAAATASRHPSPGSQRPPHPHYQRGLFENARGSKVNVRLKGSAVDLQIDEIRPLGVSAGAKAGTNLWHNAFSVRLTGPAGTRLPQGTHRVTINGKRFDLFVVPIIHRGSKPTYQAIINRAYTGRVRG